MLITRFVDIKINSSTINHFKLRGYEAKLKEIICVRVQDLPRGTHTIVEVFCDYCGNIMKRTYKDYISASEKCFTKTDACKNCLRKKVAETCVAVYGVENPMQNKNVKQELTNVIIEKYGVDHYTKTDSYKCYIKKLYEEKTKEEIEWITKKRKATFLSKYGVDNYAKTKECKIKIENTCLKKYGVSSSAQFSGTRNKYKKTMLEKYGKDNYFATDKFKEENKEYLMYNFGVEYVSQIDEVKEKVKISWKKIMEKRKSSKKIIKRKHNIPTSSQQIQIFDKINAIFPSSKLNFHVCGKFLDIALFIGSHKIDIEYDGWYWHEEKIDKIRDKILFSHNWKVFRIKSGHKIPPIKDILEKIFEMINKNELYKEIILSDWVVKGGDYELLSYTSREK